MMMSSVSAYLKSFKTSEFVSDRYVLLMLGLGAVVNWFIWHYFKTRVDSSNAFATLHFTASLGVDLIGRAADIYNIYYLALLFSAAHLVLARLTYNYDIFLSYILISLMPLLNTIMLFNGFFIVSMNA